MSTDKTLKINYISCYADTDTHVLFHIFNLKVYQYILLPFCLEVNHL